MMIRSDGVMTCVMGVIVWEEEKERCEKEIVMANNRLMWMLGDGQMWL